MATLVRCLYYPKIVKGEGLYLRYKDFFPDPEIKTEFRMNIPSRDVLMKVLPTHYLKSYLGVTPWFIDHSKHPRAYLDISEVDFGKEKLDDLLNCPEIGLARRKQILTEAQKLNASELVLDKFKPDNTVGAFLERNNPRVAKAYADVLNALGRSVSEEDLRDKIRKQEEGLWEDDFRHAQRQAEDWSRLAHQVVGAEVDPEEPLVLDMDKTN